MKPGCPNCCLAGQTNNSKLTKGLLGSPHMCYVSTFFDILSFCLEVTTVNRLWPLYFSLNMVYVTNALWHCSGHSSGEVLGYLAIWLYTITQVTKRVSKLQAIGDPKYQSGSLLVSCLIGVAVVIYTVSLVGYLSEFIFILWALGSSYLKNTEECVNTARTNS